MEINQIEKVLSNKNELISATNKCRGDILKMTTLAQSGHPGGSLSAIDILYSIYLVANIDPKILINLIGIG